MELEVVTLGENGVTEDDILVHDEQNRTLAFLLAQLEYPAFPVVFGVLYCNPAESYDQSVLQQQKSAKDAKGSGDMDALLRSGHTWQVDDAE